MTAVWLLQERDDGGVWVTVSSWFYRRQATMARLRYARRRVCPKCGAVGGEPCRSFTAQGRVFVRSDFHVERKQLSRVVKA